MSDTHISFNQHPPLPVLRLGNRRKTTSDGKVLKCSRYYLWWFPPDQDLPRDKTWQEAHDWVKWVFEHSLGWARAGVWFGEAKTPGDAHFVFRYVDPPLTCGGVRNAVGCSRGGLVEIINTHIGDPTVGGNIWYSRGVLHEGLHEVGAKHDGDGVMRVDGSNTEIRWPTDNDIEALRDRYVRLR